MSKVIRASVDFTIRRASEEDCKRFGQPLGIIEILDSDNFRQDWAVSEEEALSKIEDLVAEALGLSGGFALGYVVVEEVQKEN